MRTDLDSASWFQTDLVCGGKLGRPSMRGLEGNFSHACVVALVGLEALLQTQAALQDGLQHRHAVANFKSSDSDLKG